jgi:S1-C subfamily serine protease
VPFLVLLVALSSPRAAAADDPAALVARVRPSVVKLLSEDLLGRSAGHGSGFLVSSDGFVVTNHHVAANGPTIAEMSDGTRHTVLGVLASDEESDVAILRIEGSGYTALPLGAPTRPAVLDKVIVIGSPMGLDQTVTEGIISALRPDGLPPDEQSGAVARTSLLQITAGIAPGSSGSPVLTMDGNVIGVAQSANPLMNTYFAVDIAAVQALQARAPADGALMPLDSPARQLLLTLGLVAGVVGVAVAPAVFGWARGRVATWRRRRGRATTKAPPPPVRFLR